MRPAYIETAVEIEHAGHAVEEIVKAVEQFNKQLVHEKSLAEDRAAVSDFADLFSSVSATAATLAHLAVYSLPLDYYSRRADAIAGVSPTDLRATFNRYMTVERLKFFVVGDVVRVLPQLEVLGLGKVAVHPAFKLIKG
jgi:predicted Zn-dependent peptidase